jgi:hypothetical protein
MMPFGELVEVGEVVGAYGFSLQYRYKNVLKPALRAIGLPGAPITHERRRTVVPAVEGVRLHDYAAHVRDVASLGGYAFHAGVEVVGTQNVYTATGHLRRSDSRGRWRGCEFAARAAGASETGRGDYSSRSVVSTFSHALCV